MTDSLIAKVTQLINECIPEVEEFFEWQFPHVAGDVGYLHNSTDGFDYMFKVLHLEVDETSDVNREYVTIFFTVGAEFNGAVFALDYVSSSSHLYIRKPLMNTLRMAQVEEVVVSKYSA